MADKKTVTTALRLCDGRAVYMGHGCEKCPYLDRTESGEECIERLHADAFALLHEQEPIVRCKDCKYGEIDTAINGVLLSMTCDGVTHKPDWFCAKGERRSEDE